ncbi:MAG: sigma-E factor negative regulatory protein [Porticoccaceae bacterium]
MSESEKRLLESVSALVDGEASEIELHRILKQLDADHANQDQSVGSKWSRYQSVSQAMAGSPLGGVDISESVSSAIAEEPTYASTLLPTVKSKLYTMGRFAVAASVAFVAIIGVQQLNQVSPLQPQTIDASFVASQPQDQLKGPASQYPAGFQPNVQARTVNASNGVKLSSQPLIIKLTSADIEALNDQRMRNYLNEITRNQSRAVATSVTQGVLPVTLSTDTSDNISSQ